MPLATCAPATCASFSGAVRLIPLPETCAPAPCANASGAETVIVAPPLPPAIEATTAVSGVGPLLSVIICPGLKPSALETGSTVAPTPLAADSVVAPDVPTVAITAVSTLAPASMVIVWPTAKSATLSTLRLVAPARDAAESVVAGCNRKSLQLLSVSAPSGKRPALRCGVLTAGVAAPPNPPRPLPGVGTRQPLSPAPDLPWYPSEAQGSTSPP